MPAIPQYNHTFITRLHQKIIEIGTTQFDVALKADISTATISHYLLGRRTPKSHELHKLAKTLGCSMDWLWGASDTYIAPEKSSARIVELEAQLNTVSRTLNNLVNEISRTKSSSVNNNVTISGAATIFGNVSPTNITISPASQNSQNKNSP